MRVTVVGCGYVGLVTGVCLAEIGHTVVCVDSDLAKVASINRGTPTIYEDSLEPLLKRQLSLGMLSAKTDLDNEIANSDVSIIAVGTPFDGEAIDLSYIKTVAKRIGSALSRNRYHVVCVKSTVSPGTTIGIVRSLLESTSALKAGVDFGLCMTPEFLAEGSAVADFMKPDRIVIGCFDGRTEAVVRSLYAPLQCRDIFVTTPTTAELGKYAANSLLATLISFSNEIAAICSRCEDTDAVEVMRTLYLDRRLSPLTDNGRVTPGILTYLHAGVGFGGSCFPKDVRSLISFASTLGVNARVLTQVMSRNEDQPQELVRFLRMKVGRDLKGSRIAVLGLSFKPGTDDIRESPAIKVLDILLRAGANVIAHDPVASMRMAEVFPSVLFTENLKDAIAGADAALIITAWKEYQQLPHFLKDSQIPIVDGRRLINPDTYDNYTGIGLPIKGDIV